MKGVARPIAGLATAIVAAGFAVVVAIAGTQVHAVTCNDGCLRYAHEGVDPRTSWSKAADSWQWEALLWVGWAALIGVLATATLRWRHARGYAYASAAITGLLYVGWLALYLQTGYV